MSPIVADIIPGLIRDGYSLNPWMTPYHESAHALIAHRCGRAVSSLTVSQHGGLTRSEGPSSPEIGLLVALAGDRGELLAPSCLPELIGFSSGQDQVDAEQCLDLIARGPLDREWILANVIDQVDKLLVDERDLLHRIAKQLLQRGRLDGYQLRRLLEAY